MDASTFSRTTLANPGSSGVTSSGCLRLHSRTHAGSPAVNSPSESWNITPVHNYTASLPLATSRNPNRSPSTISPGILIPDSEFSRKQPLPVPRGEARIECLLDAISIALDKESYSGRLNTQPVAPIPSRTTEEVMPAPDTRRIDHSRAVLSIDSLCAQRSPVSQTAVQPQARMNAKAAQVPLPVDRLGFTASLVKELSISKPAISGSQITSPEPETRTRKMLLSSPQTIPFDLSSPLHSRMNSVSL